MLKRFCLLAILILLMPTASAAAATIRESQQAYLDAVNVLSAQQITRGDGVVVAVIDSGVDAAHPDLTGAILPGASFGGSTSQNGHTDPVGHGTRMAGVIAARGGGVNNALGIAPAASILPVATKLYSGGGSLAEPLRYAADHGAKVINIALARPTGEALPPGEAEAVAYAQSKDAVVVVAAGNVGQGVTANELAKLPGVVAVSGTTNDGSFWSGSAQGDFVTIAAPAVGIVTIGARNIHSTGYSTGDGTSESVAIVAGVLALIRSKYPQFDAANSINQLIHTAKDAGPLGRDSQFGYGIVDAYAAVTSTVDTVKTNPLVEAAANSDPVPRKSDSTTGPAHVNKRPLYAAIVLVLIVGLATTITIIAARRRSRQNRQQAMPTGVYTAPVPPTPPTPMPQQSPEQLPGSHVSGQNDQK